MLRWEVEDVAGGRIVARLEGTEEILHDVFRKFFQLDYSVVLALGWARGGRHADGSVMLIYDREEDPKPLFRVRGVESEKPLTRIKK